MTADQPNNYDQALVRGAFINVLGLIAKLIHPLFMVVVTWCFGPAIFGIYAVAKSLGDFVTTFAASGFADATIVYASHHADDDADADRLYRVLGNGVGLTLILSVILMITLWFTAPLIVNRWYAEVPELIPALRVLVWAIPLTALPRIGIAATKARMLMQYDAFIMGFIRPFALLGFSLLAWGLDMGLTGLMWAEVGTQAIITLLTAGAVARHFDLRRIVRATLSLERDMQVLRFAIPQTLNLTFNRFVTGLDVLMLAAFGVPAALVGFYKAGAEITRNIRQVKIVFSDALAPVAARHHASGDIGAVEETLGRVCRWTTSLSIPLLIIAVVHRSDLVQLVHSSFTGSTVFMVILLVPPFLSCAVGLIGNTIIYTGHSAWTMGNAILVTGLNALLNTILIPQYGLIGAAIATTFAASTISFLQVVELRYLEGIRLRFGMVSKAYAGLAVVIASVILLWDPADLPSLLTRVGATLGLLGIYIGTLWVVRHDEVVSILGRIRRRSDR